MNSDLQQFPHKSFEGLKHLTPDGAEYWSARELYPVLEYSTWQKFEAVLFKAMDACKNSGHEIVSHFNRTVKMAHIGLNKEKSLIDYHISRYGCYLIVQNCDPSKPVIAAGQTYFAVQTRKQELMQEAFEELTEDERRLALRHELREHNKQLVAAAKDSGVETSLDYAVFQNYGYRGLYGGMDAQAIHDHKGLTKSQKILDHMGSTELAANLFRATQTEEKLKRDRITGKSAANNVHYHVGKKVRQTIAELGGTMPEDLPTPEVGIPQLEREEKKKIGNQKKDKIK